ncbi:MAG: thioredoxin domain-containing protein [Simkaniaceae bacterium]|nr:thioredoxin domain-containing protein [Simkaniaceae bacterium]
MKREKRYPIISLATVAILLLTRSAFAFEKMDEKYLIRVGNPEATEAITHYFSLACPHCVLSTIREFPKIFDRYVKDGRLLWTFHANPSDVNTVRFLICLEKMPESRKFSFFWNVLGIALADEEELPFLLEEQSRLHGHAISGLADPDFLKRAPATLRSSEYLNQEGVPGSVPSIEKDGILVKGAPTLAKVREILR